jgi:16S rRNA (uracil1498-N3)-methyltransferase
MRQSRADERGDLEMRLSRVYVEAELHPGSLVELPPAAASHLVKVLRLRGGDELVLFRGDGREFTANVDGVRGARVHVLVGEARLVDRESPLEVTLVQAIARADRMDLIVQKATELGVARIVPVLSRRSVVRLDAGQAQSKAAHWRAIAVSACEQSGRNRLPLIETPRRLIDHLGAASPGGVRLVLDPEAPAQPPRDPAGELGLKVAPSSPTDPARQPVEPPAGAAVEVAIGPEGGFEAEELEAFAVAGFTPLRLGPRVLRTETAAIAAIAWLQTRLGDLG